MSRPPIPTALKIIRGNPGKRPLTKNEPKPDIEAKAPKPPATLSAPAKRKWKELAASLHPLGLLTELDYDALGRYCVLFARWQDAQAELAANGLTVTATNSYEVQSPYIHISNKCAELMHKIGSEFGFTPSSRTKIAIPTKKPANSLPKKPIPRQPR